MPTAIANFSSVWYILNESLVLVTEYYYLYAKEKFWLLVSLKLSGEATQEELDELNDCSGNIRMSLQLDIIDKCGNRNMPLPIQIRMMLIINICSG